MHGCDSTIYPCKSFENEALKHNDNNATDNNRSNEIESATLEALNNDDKIPAAPVRSAGRVASLSFEMTCV